MTRTRKAQIAAAPRVSMSVASARMSGHSTATHPLADGDGRVYDHATAANRAPPRRPQGAAVSTPNPTLERIKELADEYHAKLQDAAKTRAELNALIQWAKDNGESYPRLSKASGLSIATIQNIVSGRYLNERHTRGDY